MVFIARHGLVISSFGNYKLLSKHVFLKKISNDKTIDNDMYVHTLHHRLYLHYLPQLFLIIYLKSI
jgi:hypothetical protein